MRISLLDRSRTRTGESDADAVTATVERAVKADALGFHRFWASEHYAVPGVVGSAPTVLLSTIGARTRRIRFGSGGIMVPNHSPLVVAEQALLLEALYPGRVDLGLGGSLGFTPAVRRALGRTILREGEYASEVADVLSHLQGRSAFTVRPRVAPPPVFLLAVQDGLTLAAAHGLPAVIGGPLLNNAEAIDAYFHNFQRSETGSSPYLVLAVDVAIAETAERARDLALPEAWALADSRDVGEFRALQPVEHVRRLLAEERSAKKRTAVHNWMASAITGTAAEVRRSLTELLERTGASEILASVSTYDRDEVDRIDAVLASMQS